MKKTAFILMICIICVGFILFNSSQTYDISNGRSNEIANNIINILSKTQMGKVFVSQISYKKFHLLIRKCAHAFEYFLLSMALFNMNKHFKDKVIDIVVYTSFSVLFLAVIDEFYQLFISNRTSSVVDVLIDFAGGIIGMILCLIFSKNKSKRNDYI